MTAKKRARNRNKKAAATAAAAQAADTEKRPSTPTTTTLTTAIVSPDNNITQEEDDMCIHGLNLQYSNEDLKQTVKDLCDDAASNVEKVKRVICGKLPQGDDAAVAAAARKQFLRLLDSQNEVSEEEIRTEFGISTILLFKYPDEDIYLYMDWMISHFVSKGTKCLLRGDLQTARGYAIFANYSEQVLNTSENGKEIDIPKMFKFLHADEHTLCSYFRNRIPCSCLGKKYKEVKSVVKKDMCFNIECKKPNRFEIDSKSMMLCSRCRQASYCSSECQEIDWRARHKKTCGLQSYARNFGRDARKVIFAQDSDSLDVHTLLKETFPTIVQK